MALRECLIHYIDTRQERNFFGRFFEGLNVLTDCIQSEFWTIKNKNYSPKTYFLSTKVFKAYSQLKKYQ